MKKNNTESRTVSVAAPTMRIDGCHTDSRLLTQSL